MNKKDYHWEKMKRYLLVSVGIWILLSIIFFGGMNSSGPLEERLGISILCGLSPIMMYWVYIYNPNRITKEQTDEEKKIEDEKYEELKKEQQEKCLNKFLQIVFNDISDDWGAALCGSRSTFLLIKKRASLGLEKTISRLYKEVFSMYKYDYVLGCFNNEKYTLRYPESKTIEERNMFFADMGKNARYDKQFMEEIETAFCIKKDMAIIVAHYCEYKIKEMSSVPEDFTLSKLFETNYSIGYGDFVGPYRRKYLMPSQFNAFDELAVKGVKCLQIAYFYHQELAFLYSLEEESKK